MESLLRTKRPLALASHGAQPETIDYINDLFRRLVECLLLFFGRRVCANIDVICALCDLPAVDFVDNVVNVLKIVGVGDDLITSNDILWRGQSAAMRKLWAISGYSAKVASGAPCGEATNLVDNHGESW